jgi:hypothetical protein
MTDDLIKRLSRSMNYLHHSAADALEAKDRRIAELEAECACDQRNAAVSQQESVMLLDRAEKAPPKPEPVLREAWVNLYPRGLDGTFGSKAFADEHADDRNRIECRRIAWMSDGSPVPGGDDQNTIKTLTAERDALNAELATFYCTCGQSLLTGHHEDGCPYDKPETTWWQIELDRVRTCRDDIRAERDSLQKELMKTAELRAERDDYKSRWDAVSDRCNSAGWKDAMGASCNGCAHQPHPDNQNYPESCIECRRFYGDLFEKKGER